jgi:hypothetical protein
MSRISHFLDNQLTDGGLQPYMLATLYHPRKIPGTPKFIYMAILTPASSTWEVKGEN